MAHSRPAKRQRVGGAYHDPVPFVDDFSLFHAREGRLVRAGNEVITASDERAPQHEADRTWNAASSWLPVDDSQFALDPDSEWYDEVMDGEVTEDHVPVDGPLSSSRPKKRVRSKLSRRPHVVWKDVHRQTYLEEMIRWEGRADFRNAKHCSDCLARSSPHPGPPDYRCRECFLADLVCQSCCVKRHRANPLHRIERWTGSRFKDVSLKSIGLKVQLNHASLFCENPITSHTALLVIHTNGIHEVAIQYCGCSREIPTHIQLLRRGFYPASQITVKTCATFPLLNLLHKFALMSKGSTYDFYRALEKLTNNTGIAVPKLRYRGLFRMVMQWRHLKLLKWGGRAHDPAGVIATQRGELAVLCPSCPRPGVNLPENWEDEPAATKFLYMMFLCMDANFRLKNQIVSNYSQDPGLGTGWAYMVPREEYENYVLSRASDGDISTCVGLQALAKMNTKFSKGLRYTGVGGVMCGRSEMIMPTGIGNLQKGERFSNMDYIAALVIYACAVSLILFSYDIACQWFINLFRRVEHWPPALRIPASTRLIPAIPKLHEPMHGGKNHQQFSLNFIPGVGKSDMETPERVWAGHNALGNSTKTQGPGGRHDVLDDHFGFWNWQKYIGIGKTLISRYKAALSERNRQVEGHRGFTSSLDPELVERWEAVCVAWEDDTYPKSHENPYQTEGIFMTEAEVRKEFAEEDEIRLSAGEESLHDTSASSFVFMGLELEDFQRRIRRQAKNTPANATARQSGNLTEQRNILRTRIRAWEEILPIYMPGLLQQRSTLESTSQAADPEDIIIWLPSRIPEPLRSRICQPELSGIEEKIRTAHCYDSLDAVRHVLTIKARMVLFKNKNVRGQRNGTRSRAVIDRVHERARVAAEKYRVARGAKLALAGEGEWELVHQVLQDSDIRGYQDPNHLPIRRGHRGTLEDGQTNEAADDAMGDEHSGDDVENITLLNERRERRDGTGETRRTLSWIWTTKSRSPNPDDEGDDILQTEWAKSRARAARCQEEILLLKEEMRRVLAFLNWKSSWWLNRRNSRVDITSDIVEGLQAYAETQADLQQSLKEHFCTIWKSPLTEVHQAGPEDDCEENEVDHDDDDEEERAEGDDLDVHEDGGEGYTGADDDDEDAE